LAKKGSTCWPYPTSRAQKRSLEKKTVRGKSIRYQLIPPRQCQHWQNSERKALGRGGKRRLWACKVPVSTKRASMRRGRGMNLKHTLIPEGKRAPKSIEVPDLFREGWEINQKRRDKTKNLGGPPLTLKGVCSCNQHRFRNKTSSRKHWGS